MPPRPKKDYETCKTCTHSENIHTKFDGRSPKKERDCHAYLCKCKNFVA